MQWVANGLLTQQMKKRIDSTIRKNPTINTTRSGIIIEEGSSNATLKDGWDYSFARLLNFNAVEAGL